MQQEEGSIHELDEALNAGINEYNMRVTGDRHYVPVAFALRDEIGRVRGGIAAGIWGGWMHIGALFVDEDLRGQGWGRRLLGSAEGIAREAGCRGIHLETFSFQARPFYEKEGFTVIATLEDYPPGHSKYMMRKSL